MTSRESDKATRQALDYGITIFKALKAHSQFITDNAVATSAMLQAIGERFPEVADNYERYRGSMSETSPIHEKTRAMCARIDVLLAELEKVKRKKIS